MSKDEQKTRSIGSLETWEPEDKSFSKHILQDGHGDKTPNCGSTCTGTMQLVDECELDEKDLNGYDLTGKEFEVTIGEGDTLLSEFLDQVYMSMKEGERAYIKGKVDAKGQKVNEFDIGKKAFKFNVFLKSFNRVADSIDLEQDERLELAQHHKNAGTELYKNDNITFSIKRFNRAIQYLSDMEPVDKLNQSLKEQYSILKTQCFLNLGACYLKNQDYENVIKQCSDALDLEDSNIKGLFRRGQANTKLHKYEEAYTDLSRAIKLDPENKAISSQLRTLDGLKRKEKQMYQKMFTC